MQEITIQKIVATSLCDCEVYLSTTERFSFNEEDYAGPPLRDGMAVDEEGYDRLVRAAEVFKCARKAVGYLAGASMSKRRLYDKLVKASFGREIALEVVERMALKRLICDEDYALDKALWLKESKNFGPIRIRGDLVSVYGVPLEVAREVVQSSELGDFEVNLRALIRKKFSLGDLSDKEGRRRAAAALIRAGYTFEEARGALIEFINKELDSKNR